MATIFGSGLVGPGNPQFDLVIGGTSMAINFIPNDPLSPQPATRKQSPRPGRPAGRAGLTFTNPSPEQQYDLKANPKEFLYWQCREAALLAVETWESLAGNLTAWSPEAVDPKSLEVDNDHVAPEISGTQKLNAYYDRAGLRFFIYDSGSKTYYSGLSTDTVTHEAGHALLDSLRPEFFDSLRPEVNAFHESFGDCWALLSALTDKETRQAVLKACPTLDKPNFVESLSEYLSQAILEVIGAVSPSKPRHARNKFQYQLPTTLSPGKPEDPPEFLSAEPHSFSRVFTGCFYDTVVNLFATAPIQNEASLLAAAQTAGRLLIAAARVARHTSRFYLEMGQRMVQADQSLSGGANAAAIQKAFAGHNLTLGGTGVISTPTTALAGEPPTFRAVGAHLTASTLKDLRNRMSAEKGSKFAVSSISVAGKKVAEVRHRREIPLAVIDKRLKGVVAYAMDSVQVGESGQRAAVLGAMPNLDRANDEISHFVKSLVQMDRIVFDAKKPRSHSSKKKTAAVASADAYAERTVNASAVPTHIVRTRGSKKVLERIRFVCGPCCHGHSGHIVKTR
ncbi:MAG: hypothetical protein WCJ31_07445 [Planctomycetia bacterium]